MKKLLTLLIVAISLVSCKRVGPVPESYSIEMAIYNTNNENAVKGLNCSPIEHRHDRGYCIISEYEFQCESTTENIYSFDPTLNTSRGTIILYAAPPLKTHPDEIKFEIVCDHIFKDSEKHEIITKWIHPIKTESYCTSVIFDNVEYTPTIDKNKIANSFVKVVVHNP